MDLRDHLQAALASDYSIERELAGGGMSRVFVAEEKTLGRKVVVKVLPGDMTGQLSMDRFRREIALAAQLQHPHIVPLLAAGDADGLPYFTMPYVRGESLRARLASHGEMPVADAVRILREVASALAYAHGAGVVHRDIKPDNILISGDAAMVTDFGVAKAVSASTGGDGSALTSLGIALGTPAYMAPEQAAASPHVDHRADLYAWGLLAYELLTGGTPFAGRSAQALLAAHVNEMPEDIAKRRPNVPAPLAALVMRCLEKRAADRPQSASEIVRAVDELSTPSGGLSPARAIPVRMPRRAWIAFGVVAVAVVVALIVNATRQSRPPEPQQTSRVAVIPVDANSADTTDTFAEGMVEALVGALTTVPGLEVRPSGSWHSIDIKRMTDADIGARLRVDNLLRVSIRRAGASLRVGVELVHVPDARVIWSQPFARSTGDVFLIQDSIATQTATALRGRLGAAERARISSYGTQSLEAFDLYSRGRIHLARFNEPSLRRAISLFDSALVKDPKYALAYSSIAEAWIQLSDDWLPPREGYARAEQAAQRAVALDPAAGFARGVLAMARVTLRRDFRAGLDEARLGYQTDSLTANSAYAYGALLGFNGHLDSAAVLLARASRLDPVNPVYLTIAGWFEYWNGHYERAIAVEKAALDMLPGLSPAWVFIGESQLALGRPAEALATSDSITGQVDAQRSLRAAALATLGRTDEAKRVTAALVADAARRYVSGDYIALPYLALGNRDEAMRWLERANDDRSQLMLQARRDARWLALRGDPRFESLLARIGAP